MCGTVAKRLRRRSRKPKIEGSNPSRALPRLFFFIFLFDKELLTLFCASIWQGSSKHVFGQAGKASVS